MLTVHCALSHICVCWRPLAVGLDFGSSASPRAADAANPHQQASAAVAAAAAAVDSFGTSLEVHFWR